MHGESSLADRWYSGRPEGSELRETKRSPGCSDQGLHRRDFVKVAGGAALGLAPQGGRTSDAEAGFRSAWKGSRTWIGPEYWANPLQDWRVEDGEVVGRAAAGRTLHLLTHQVGATGNGFQTEVSVRLADSEASSRRVEATWAGFAFGVRGELAGYQHALVRPTTQVNAGLRGDGRVFCGDMVGEAVPLGSPVRLMLSIRPSGSAYEARLSASAGPEGQSAEVAVPLEASQLPGNIALAAQASGRAGPETSGVEWGFRDWRVSGPRIEHDPDQLFGPILWTQYTLSRGTLKLAAHFPPLGDSDDMEARLETSDGRGWQAVSSAAIEPLSRTAVFRVDRWDDAQDVDYRVVYSWHGENHHWRGTIRRDPREKEQLLVGIFSCDHGEVFPQQRMVRNVALQNPDIVFFAGDQIYESYGGFGVARRKPSGEAMLDYLRKYWQFGWTWRAILKDRPSIVIPDDHDVFQGNIWGQSGRALPLSSEGWGFENGGYLMGVDWVNAVQRTQAGHLPDPHDPVPCDSGIDVYFTEMRYGGASFAIIEDRKFKSGPGDILSPSQRAEGRRDPRVVDVEGAELLGPRQEAFLNRWAQASGGSDFRLVCSQTIFCKATTHSGGRLERRLTDLDCGGWPQAGRNRALSALRPVQDVIMLHGDQHVGSLVRHGIDEWEDGPIGFMVPGTSNGFPRAWWPEQPGEDRIPDAPEWTGRYRDGLGNRITVLAAANPERGSNTDEGQRGLNAEEIAHIKGSGHGTLLLDRQAQTATFEIWRHAFDAANPRPDDRFAGFPIVLQLRG